MGYSYFLLKPDAEKKFGEIKTEIESNFERVQYFAVTDWEDTIKKVYKEHYDNDGEKFKNNYQAFIDTTKELYSNYGVLALVKEEELEAQELAKKVLDFKMMIRERFCRLGEIGIISNMQHGRQLKNSVKMFEGKEFKKSPKYMDKIGNYRFHFFNYIHSPDSEIANKNELEILMNNDNFSKENRISNQDLDKMVKYKTFGVIQEYEKDEDKNEERRNIIIACK